MTRTLPVVPRLISLPAGPVKITRVEALQEKEKCSGKFNWFTRSIELDAEMGRTAAWLTLEHERVHVVLQDAGVLLSNKDIEAVCNAIAADRVAQMISSVSSNRRRKRK